MPLQSSFGSHITTRNKKSPVSFETGLGNKSPATCYSPTTECRSTIAAEALNFRVRYGNGCYLLAMITGKTVGFQSVRIETVA